MDVQNIRHSKPMPIHTSTQHASLAWEALTGVLAHKGILTDMQKDAIKTYQDNARYIKIKISCNGKMSGGVKIQDVPQNIKYDSLSLILIIISALENT